MSWLCYVAWRWGVFLWGWKESRRDNGREGGREGRGLEGFCSCFEWDIVWWWNTAGKHQDVYAPRERARARAETGAHTYVKLLLVHRTRLLVSFCLIFSFPFLVFFWFWLVSLLSHLFWFSSRGTGASGVAACWTAAACCAADVMGESCIDRHPLVSSETRVVAQFHPS